MVGEQAIRVARKQRDPIVPPRPGEAALLDPRQEDLMAFLEIELTGTFEVQPRLGLSILARKRAEYTISILRLNSREYLRKSRRNTYRSLVAMLEQYIARRGARPDEVVHVEREIRVAPHPAVWFEMRRQHRSIAALRPLFEQAPEALTWDWTPDAD